MYVLWVVQLHVLRKAQCTFCEVCNARFVKGVVECAMYVLWEVQLHVL